MRSVVALTAVGLVALVAAAPQDTRPPDELIRAGNAAVGRGEFDAAEKLYAAAEERTTDPGLVAFNKAAAHFHRREYAAAEQHYTRALDDAAAPAERRARALYNRGVCLVKRERAGLGEYRTAIDSFERCLGMAPADPGLVADARHNLELAKLLWAAARAKERKKPLPNEPTDDEPPQPQPPRPDPAYDPFDPANGGPDGGPRYAGGTEPLGSASKGGTPRGTDAKTGGKGNQPVLANADRLPEWTDRQVREYLDRLAGRLAKDRRGTAVLTAPAERPNVKDW
jgi:tetratricopeptide (TPR) repeat protein